MTIQPAGVIPDFVITDRLRKAREYAGMDQGQLADAMGVDRKTIGNNEHGRVKPRKLVLRAWAMATGVSYEWLATGEVPQPSGPSEELDQAGPITSRYAVPEQGPLDTRRLRRVA